MYMSCNFSDSYYVRRVVVKSVSSVCFMSIEEIISSYVIGTHLQKDVIFPPRI